MIHWAKRVNQQLTAATEDSAGSLDSHLTKQTNGDGRPPQRR